MKDKENYLGRELSLLSFLAGTLAHKIRGHLSIISNDLQYFNSVLPKGECERSLTRCKEISKVFESALSLFREKLKKEEFEVVKILKESFGSSVTLDLHVSDLLLLGDRELLGRAFLMISELLRDVSKDEGSQARIKEPRLIVSLMNGGFSLKLVSQIVRKFEIDTSHGWRSFSEFFSAVLQRDSLNPIFIDAVIWAHFGDTAITIGDKLCFEIFFRNK